VFAWGLVTGVAMVKSGLTPAESLLLTFSAYAGSAQLAALPLIAAQAPLWLIALTAVVVNLRFVVYSVVTRPYFARESAWRRLWLGYMVGDVMFVKFITRTQRRPDDPHAIAYYLGGASCNWLTWQVASVVGILAAGSIPAQWGLELAGTLALVALVVPLCTQRPALAGVAVAATVASLAHALPLKLGMLLGILCGIGAAMAVELRRRGSTA
jgi:predicted branched-subunit amino acid permease